MENHDDTPGKKGLCGGSFTWAFALQESGDAIYDYLCSKGSRKRLPEPREDKYKIRMK
jgi:hypothetical protein